MSSISRQGIWIDCKALLSLTYQLLNHLTNKDRILIGDRMMKSNLDMIEAFSSAYSRGDEKLTFDSGKVYYDIDIKGCKRKEIDRLQSCYENYRALWEFVFGCLDIQRWSDDKIKQKQAEFVRLLAKIETGISKWRSGTSRQVVISRKRHNPDQTL
jgi:hypothetical protein